MTQINNDITLLVWATQQDGTVKRQADSPADDLSRDRWLAALEDDAFGLPDGGLNKEHNNPGSSAGRQHAEIQANFESTPQSARAQISTLADTRAPIVSGAAQAIVPPALMPTPAFNTASLDAAIQQRSAVVDQRVARSAEIKTAQPFDALVNQSRFFDVNVQLTKSKQGLTLWIRDFKQKYQQDLQHWINDVKSMLAEQNMTLYRVVINGKAVASTTHVFGDNHGD